MKKARWYRIATLSPIFLAAFFLTQLSLLPAGSFALDNSSLSGTYAYVLKFSGFYGSEVNGGFGATDIEHMSRGGIVLDGAWTRIHTSNPELMATGNLDGN